MVDRIVIKNMYLHPVFEHDDILALFAYIDRHESIEWKVFFGFILFQAMRPAEVLALTWDNLKWDGTTFTELTHLVFKARRIKNRCSTTILYKAVRKPIYCALFARWLKELWEESAKYCHDNRIFYWHDEGNSRKFFRNMRKQLLIDGNPLERYFLKSLDRPSGESNYYILSSYALRRTSFTFHFYATTQMDLARLSKMFGHSHIDTTLAHYTYPRESIKLDEGITSFDVWLFKNQPSEQTKLSYYKGMGICARKDPSQHTLGSHITLGTT